ncbi:MAG: iron-siderophore ABC transporter substrate-binding protein [Kamptonema sp. SIO4C4]|nr:iron-siderophore ABC transporter substrate-binding protein [Kamptonema sp. SIO4C4]
MPPPSQLTRTIEHGMGATQVPETPQRIVTLDFATTESLLAINILPVGTPNSPYPYLQERLQDVEHIGSFEPNLERVLALQPDLILGITYWQDIYAQASKIAPTLLFPLETSANWKQILLSVGEVVNRSEAVEQVMRQYEARLEEFKSKMGADSLEVSVVRVYPDRVELYQKNIFAGTILADAGLSRPPSQQGNQPVQRISKEQLQKADGDVIFLWTHGNNFRDQDDARSAIAQLEADPLWSRLEAVQQGKVYQVNGNYWIGTGPIAANLVIDDLFKYLIETP